MIDTKTNGAEFKRYYNDDAAWPDDTYHDDSVILVDGLAADDHDIDLLSVSDHAEISIEYGSVFSGDGQCISLLPEHFRDWKKRQATIIATVEVPVKRKKEFAEYAKSNGLKVNWG